MRLSVVIFSLCLAWCRPLALSGQDVESRPDSARTRYEKMMTRRMEMWQRLIPDHYKMQFAGSIGMVSAGTGWTYGKKLQWETDLILGFLPKFESEHHKVVFTVKQSYVPWKLRIKESPWVVQPLSCSLFLSSVLNEKFWTREPDRYPKGYYGFSTRIRANLSLGQRIMFDIPDVSDWLVQDISLYYELGACDTDFCTFFGDRTIKFKDILSLAIGVKVHI